MDTTTARKLIGYTVTSDCEIWGILEYVTEGGWAGIRGPNKGLDEIQVSRIEPSKT